MTTTDDRMTELLQRIEELAEGDPAWFRTLAAYASALLDETIDCEAVTAAVERTESIPAIEGMLTDVGAYAAWDARLAAAGVS